MALGLDSGNLKVIRHNPVRNRRITAILVVTVIILVFFAYWYGGNSANLVSTRLGVQNMSLEERAEALQKDDEILRQRVAVLESAARVDREALKNVRILVRQKEEEIEQLNKELAFYKNIMAPEEVESGIRVAGLDLMPAERANSYRIRLVISQVAHLNPFLKGQLTVSLSGKNNGKNETHSLHKLAGLEESSSALGFKYFQALPDNQGFLEFQLPKGFKPESIDVTVRVQKGLVKSFNQTFDWDKELAVDVRQD